MLGLFSVLADKIKPKFNCLIIDNWVFKLHYRATVIIFLVSTILVTSREYIGEHIKCLNDMNNAGFEKVIETFCFFTSTFTVVEDYDVNRLRLGYAAHPGVGPYGLGSTRPIRRHMYYQWVPFLLFGQAIMFYLTHLLWKKLENGTIKKLVSGLDHSAFALLDKQVTLQGQDIPTKEEKQKCIDRLKSTFVKQVTFNKTWAWWLMLCEILNVVHVAFQVYITHQFLGKQFFNLGPNLLANGSKILDQVFPKVTKCTFHMYGHSGSIQNHDALCILALNIINEKIFLFLWFWFVVLFAASCLVVIWRGLSWILYSRSIWFNQFVFGSSSKGRLYPWHIRLVIGHCGFADWLLLKYMSKNLNSLAFRDLFLNIFEDLEEKKPFIGFEHHEKRDFANINKLE